MTSIRVYNSIGNKNVHIKRQRNVEIEINKQKIDTIFLVAP